MGNLSKVFASAFGGPRFAAKTQTSRRKLEW
jgi:hypothetical protein